MTALRPIRGMALLLAFSSWFIPGDSPAQEADPPQDVLIVDGDPDPTPDGGLKDADYLRLALAPSPDAENPFRPRIVALKEWQESDLENIPLVILADVPSLTLDQAEWLDAMLQRGGGVWFLLGPRTDATAYNEILWRDGEGWFPAKLDGQVSREAEALEYPLEVKAPNHPVVRYLNREGVVPGVQVMNYVRVEPAEAAVIALAHPEGDPALLLARRGKGRVALLTTSLIPDWSTWPRAILFVPLVHELSHHLSGTAEDLPLAIVIDHSANMGLAQGLTLEALTELQRQQFADAGFREPTPMNLARAAFLQERGQLLEDLLAAHPLNIYFADGTGEAPTELHDSQDVKEFLSDWRTRELETDAPPLPGALRQILEDAGPGSFAGVVVITEPSQAHSDLWASIPELFPELGFPIFPVVIGPGQPQAEPMHALLIDSRPHIEIDHLRRFLNDQGVQVHAWFAEIDPEVAERDPELLRELPDTAEELAPYNMLILGDVDPNDVSEAGLREWRAFVEQGGGLLMIANSKHPPSLFADTSLAELLPFDVTETAEAEGEAFRITWTPEGQNQLRLPEEDLVRELPKLGWLIRVGEIRPLATVIAQAEGETRELHPAILTRAYGQGRVWFQATDQTWRWRQGSQREFYERFWRGVIQHVAPDAFSRTESALTELAERTGGKMLPLDELPSLAEGLLTIREEQP